MQLIFNNVGFSYNKSSDYLFVNVNLHFSKRWTGIIGANGVGKTTLLKLASGILIPSVGTIVKPSNVIYCPQRVDNPPDNFYEFINASDNRAFDLIRRFAIENNWLGRWESLSHGERKRVQIAVALWMDPNILAIDEPANHIDIDARKLLIDELIQYTGIGLIVSHDRNIIDELCEKSVLIDPPSVVMYTGGYSAVSEYIKMADKQMRKEHDIASEQYSKIVNELNRRKSKAITADKRRSKRNIDPRDNDAKGKIDAARVSGKDGKAGRLASQLDGRIRRAQEHVSQTNYVKRYDTDFWMPGSASSRNTLFSVDAGRISLGEDRILCYPELSMQPKDRIAVTGKNGTGKSTLIRHIIANLSIQTDKIVYMPQEILLDESRQIMEKVNMLSNDDLGKIMTIVSCLGSRPGRLVGSNESSPGEIRKIMLAMGVMNMPHIIIMDEPTNHLDIPAIECLEDALINCPCGLLLVSHDQKFLNKLTDIRWNLSADEENKKISLNVHLV